jgi:hypothetical protein
VVFLSSDKFWDSIIKVMIPNFAESPDCNASPTEAPACTIILLYKCFAFSFIICI